MKLVKQFLILLLGILFSHGLYGCNKDAYSKKYFKEEKNKVQISNKQEEEGNNFLQACRAFYSEENLKSNYKEVPSKNEEEKDYDQIAVAFTKIFAISGYFDPEFLWSVLYQMGFEDETVLKKAFLDIVEVVKRYEICELNVSGIDFKHFSTEVFASKYLTFQDVCDIIFLFGKCAFGRVDKKERNELKSLEWMAKNENIYMEAVKCLGLIDEKKPALNQYYDEVWIFGASFQRMCMRSLTFIQYMADRGTKLVRFLAGNRVLWSEIDGIGEDTLKEIEEMKQKLKILYENMPFLKYVENLSKIESGNKLQLYFANKKKLSENEKKTKLYCPEDASRTGLVKGRTYLDYKSKESDFITETDIAKYLRDTLLKSYNAKIVDNQTVGSRPTTETTIHAAMQYLLNEKNDKSTYYILLVSNQPYVERQKLTAERAVANFIKQNGLKSTVVFHGCGFGSRERITQIHSEFGALIYEKYFNAIRSEIIVNVRSIEELEFSLDKKVPPMPEF